MGSPYEECAAEPGEAIPMDVGVVRAGD
jgi:hypothetical protein